MLLYINGKMQSHEKMLRKDILILLTLLTRRKKMVKVRIVWDVDCVIADMMPQICTRVKRDFNLALAPSEITKWSLQELTGISNIRNIFDSQFFQTQKPIPDAQRLLPIIWERTYSVLATYGLYQTYNSKAQWITKNFPFINIDKQLIFIKKKYLLDGDIFVDDCLMNCIKWLQRHPKGIAFMPPYPHNEIPSDVNIHRLVRAKSWQDMNIRITHLLDFVDNCQNYMTINTRQENDEKQS